MAEVLKRLSWDYMKDAESRPLHVFAKEQLASMFTVFVLICESRYNPHAVLQARVARIRLVNLSL